MIFPKISSESILALANKHIDRYQNWINSGVKYVRMGECKNLKSIWIKIKNNMYDQTKFSEEMMDEFVDACYDDLYQDTPCLTKEEQANLENYIGEQQSELMEADPEPRNS